MALAVLTACGGGGPPASPPTDTTSTTTSSSTTTETFPDPDPEPTTTDPPPPNPDPDPAISLARLPVGGNNSVDDPTDPTLQCAEVNWIASDQGQIPEGSAVEITGYVFDPAVFEARSERCSQDAPSCWQYRFRPGQLQCRLLVKALAPVAEDAQPRVGMTGLVYCPDNESPACRDFIEAVAQEDQISVDLNVPQIAPPTTDEPPTTTTTDGPPPTSTTTEPTPAGQDATEPSAASGS